MTLSISDGTTTITPLLILGYKSARSSGNVEHVLVDGTIAISLRASALRNGTLEQFYLTEAEASAAELLHTAASSFALVYDDRETTEMTYVVAAGGRIERELDSDTRDRWIVRVDYREVVA